MADSAPATANRWTFFTSLTASLIPLLTALVVGGGGVLGVQHLTKKPEPIVAADPPRPTPIACEQQFHDLGIEAKAIKTDLAALRQLADEHWPKRLLPRRAPSKTKAAQVLK